MGQHHAPKLPGDALVNDQRKPSRAVTEAGRDAVCLVYIPGKYLKPDKAECYKKLCSNKERTVLEAPAAPLWRKLCQA